MHAKMIEVPSGVFRFGSCASELGRVDNECPPKAVSIQGPDLASHVAGSGSFQGVFMNDPRVIGVVEAHGCRY